MAKKKKLDQNPVSVEVLVESIVNQYGDGVILYKNNLHNTEKCESISTGAINLDVAIGIGGIPRGRITEIYGPESSGKTTLALTIAANAQQAGGKVAYIDTEHALDTIYAKAIGLDINEALISQPDNAEQAFDIIELLAASKLISLIVVDSVAALVPKSELEGTMGDSNIGLQARLLSQACRKLVGIIKKTNTTLLFINQLREKIGVMFGSPEVTTGGRALKFYSSVRLDIRRIATIKEGNKKVSNMTRVKVVKNKVGIPFKEAEFEIIFGHGINKEGCLLDLAVENEIVTKRGSNYYYNDQRIGISRAKACEYLKDDRYCFKQIEDKLLGNEPAVKSSSDTDNTTNDDNSELKPNDNKIDPDQ